jgi:hypothetical protein
MQNFSCLGEPGVVFIKIASGHVMLKLCFYFQRDMWVTECVAVHPGRETSMQYFSYLGGPGDISTKSVGTHYTELVLLHPVGSVGQVVHSGASGLQNIDTLFFMLVWDLYGFDKKRTETHYVELVFLYPVGSVGHVMLFGASREQNIDALFFIQGWAWCGFHKKRDRTRFAELVFLHSVESAGHVVHSVSPERETSM